MKENIDIKQSVNAITHHIERVSFPCPKCGKTAEADVSVILTSYLGQYSYYCPYCGAHGSVLCSEVDNYQLGKKVWEIIDESINEPVELQADTKCIICGEPVKISMRDNHSKICEKCKKAVLKLRKMLEDEDND